MFLWTYKIHSKSARLLARNLGIKKSSGKYLYFLDSDDSLKNNSLKILFEQVKKIKFGLYFSLLKKIFINIFFNLSVVKE